MEGRGTVASALAVVTAGQCPAFMTGALAVQIRGDIGFGMGELGLAVGTFFVASAAGSGVLGHVVEGLGSRRGMRIAVAASTVSLLGIAGAWSWLSLVGFMAVGGLGNAIGQPAANLSLAHGIAQRHHGLVFGIKQSAIPTATLLGGLAVPALALTIGWRWAFVLIGLAAVAAMMTIPADSHAAGPAADAPEPAAGEAAAASPTPWLLPLVVVSIAGGLGAVVGNSLGAFLVSSAVEGGVGEGAAGYLVAVGSVVGLSMRVFLGWFADRSAVRPLRAMAVLLAAGGVGCLLLVGDQLAVLGIGTVLGFGAGWAWPGLFNLAVVRSHRQAPAKATGITQTGVYVGAASGPVLFGAVVERTSFDVAWMMIAVVALLSAALTLVGSRALRDDAAA